MIETSISEEILKGSNCLFRTGKDSDALFNVGFVKSFSINKITQKSAVYVLGDINPITKDTNEIMCLILINEIIPNKKLLPKEKDSNIDSIRITDVISNLLKYLNISSNILDYVDFYNENEDKKIASFYDVKVINGGQYLIGLSKKY